MLTLACDFETVNDSDDCRVWSWGAYDIDSEGYYAGLDLEDFWFFLACRSRYNKNVKLVFHNAKFDFSFLEYQLWNRGYVWTKNTRVEPMEYTSLLASTGQFYSASFMINSCTFKVVDSAKLIVQKLREFSKIFDLPVTKGDIDYNKYRPIGYIPTPDEKDYQKRDCILLGMGYKILLDNGYKRLTASANALQFFKDELGKANFNHLFPRLKKDIDTYLRKAYRGAWCMVNPEFQNKVVGKGLILDVNSEYPYHNCYSLLPYGLPIFYKGEYVKNDNYPLYIQRIEVDCKVLQGHLPTIIVSPNGRFVKNEYLEDTHGMLFELTLTSVDMELLFKHYEIFEINYLDGYAFRGSNQIFRNYFETRFKQKEEAVREENSAKKNFAKLEMNGLGGKFGTNPVTMRKVPFMDEDGVIKYKYIEEERDSVYVPVIAFVIAYGRKQVTDCAHDNIDRFLYSDTDSVHLLGWELPDNLLIDKSKIGAWDCEGYFIQAKYIRQKTYIEKFRYTEKQVKKHVKDKGYEPYRRTYVKVTCAGLPNCDTINHMMIKDFREGMTVKGLKQKRVKGGVVLFEHEFTLKF